MNLNEIVKTYNCKREAFILILNYCYDMNGNRLNISSM